jgi:hypothetical protein
MRSPRRHPSLALLLPLLLLALLLPGVAASQPSVGTAPTLTAEVRAELELGAGSTSLPSWQRGVMLDLARAGRSPESVAVPGVAAETPVTTAATASVDGAWDLWTLPGTVVQPYARYAYGAVYDPVRNRMIVFGGYAGGFATGDVWALSLSDTPTWTHLTPAGSAPCARWGHGAIYDPTGDRMIVFGGCLSSNVFLNDVWALSLSGTPAWTQLAPAGPLPPVRQAMGAAYDPVRGRMIVFGGQSGSAALGDVWALSLGDAPAWAQLAPSGTSPRARYYHSMVYDAARDRMVVFGGRDSTSNLGEVWALTLADTPAWALLAPTGTPPTLRYGHAAVYDAARDRMVVFGGYRTSCQNDVWELTLGGTPAWVRVTATGTSPTARHLHNAVYDPARGRMIVFGGNSSNTGSVIPLGDVQTLTLGTSPAWAEVVFAAVPGTPPPAQGLSTMIPDPSRDAMIVFGGLSSNGGVPLAEVWELTLGATPTWTLWTPSGAAPSARDAHTAIYDPVRDRMIVFGGASRSYLNEVWALSLSGTPTWTQLTPSGTAPSARLGHTAIYDPMRDRMIVFGGNSMNTGSVILLGDVWALSLSGTPTWMQLTPSGTAPGARKGHSAIYDPVRDRMVVFGGYDGVTNFGDIWVLTLGDAPAWTQLSPAGAGPHVRDGHRAVYDPVRDRMVLYGGRWMLNYNYTSAPMTDVWALSLSGTATWTQLDPIASPPPYPRFYYAAAYDPAHDRMVMFGGGTGGPDYNDVWSLTWGEPATVSVTCPEAAMWMAGSSVTLDYGITNPYGFAQIADYTLTSARDWPGFPITGSVTVGVGTTTVPIAVPAPDTAAGNTNELTFTVRTRSVPEQASATHELRSAVVPVQLALVSAEAEPHLARLTWYTATGAGLTATVYRRGGAGEWAALGTVAADGSGQIVYEDRTVVAGTRYGYRLGVSENGTESYLGEAWVEVPVAVAFALAGAEPNPAVRQLQVAFALPDAAGARLEAYDVTGRRVAQVEVGGLGAGRHVVKLGGELRGGVYLVRLTRGEQTLTTRAVVVR